MLTSQTLFYHPEFTSNCPPIIKDAQVLYDNQRLFTNFEIEQLNEKFKSANVGRYHRRMIEVQDEHGNFSKSPYGIIKGDRGLYAVYRNKIEDKSVIVGVGGTAIVKYVSLLSSGKFYILKIIQEGRNLTRSKARAIYLAEFNALKKINRADTASLISVSKKGVPKFFLIMELASGYELYQLLSDRNYLLPKTPSLLKEIAIRLLLELINIHAAGLLILDIKSENIILDPVTCDITHIDFGLALEFDPNKNTPAIGSIRGTPECMPPEVLQFAFTLKRKKGGCLPPIHYTKAVDIYSEGIVLCELLLGLDFQLDPQKKLVISQASKPLIQEEAITDILLKMIHFDPNQRPQLTEVVQVFEAARLPSVASISTPQPIPLLIRGREKRTESKLTEKNLKSLRSSVHDKDEHTSEDNKKLIKIKKILMDYRLHIEDAVPLIYLKTVKETKYTPGLYYNPKSKKNLPSFKISILREITEENYFAKLLTLKRKLGPDLNKWEYVDIARYKLCFILQLEHALKSHPTFGAFKDYYQHLKTNHREDFEALAIRRDPRFILVLKSVSTLLLLPFCVIPPFIGIPAAQSLWRIQGKKIQEEIDTILEYKSQPGL